MSTNDDSIGCDFTPVYITVAVCAAFLVTLIIVNLICFCCSKYKWYWRGRNTGNRQWLTLWSSTFEKNNPLDLSKLKGGSPTKTQHEKLNDDTEAARIQQPQ